MGLYLLLLLTTGALAIGGAAAASADCNYYQGVAAGQTLQVFSPNYPNRYPNNTDCRWEAVAPSNSKLILTCSEFNVPKSNNCTDDRFSVSPTGDSRMSDAQVYCGNETFTVESTNNRMVITLTSHYFGQGGTVMCSLTATVPSTPTSPICECGWKKEPRIVNGRETGVNEYPMMAGLVDFQIRGIFCGTTIIASRYTLSAAHCLINRQTVLTAVVVGEHDITTGTETNSTRLLWIDRFEIHPSYNSVTQQNDIAVIRVTEDIVFSLQVGPACLPFRFPTTSVGTVVDVLGWGTDEFGGQESDRLMETQLDVVDFNRCQQAFGSKVSATTQLCTFRSGTDACQLDSGGPLLWTGPGNRLYLVGVIGSGGDCDSADPEFNMRVYPYINWILSVTNGNEYCRR